MSMHHRRTRATRTPRVALAATCLFLALPMPALACQVIGMFNAGPGAAPTPICNNHNAPAAGGGYPSYPGPSLIEIIQEKVRRNRAARDRREALEAMPGYQAYLRGEWSYFDSGAPADGGPRRCGASFAKEGKVLLLHGDAAPDSPAMLTFVDLDPDRSQVPPSREPRLVAVSLAQTGAPRAAVRAWHHAMGDAGAITFAVPTLQAGIDGLLETSRTRLRIDGRDVFDLEYHGGLAAQARLRRCLAGQAPEP